MSTGVETFGSAAELGAIYPFTGSEGLLVVIGAGVWIGWHIWQLRNEAREYNVEIEEIKDKVIAHKVLD